MNEPLISMDVVTEQLKGVGSDELKKIRDGLRVADSAASVVMWKRQKAGEKVFEDTTYDPDERIKHYTDRGNKYMERVITHGIEAVMELLASFLPSGIIELLKKIFEALI